MNYYAVVKQKEKSLPANNRFHLANEANLKRIDLACRCNDFARQRESNRLAFAQL